MWLWRLSDSKVWLWVGRLETLGRAAGWVQRPSAGRTCPAEVSLCSVNVFPLIGWSPLTLWRIICLTQRPLIFFFLINHRNFFSHSSGGCKSKIRLPAQSGSGEASLLLVCRLWTRRIARGGKGSPYKGIHPIAGAGVGGSSWWPNASRRPGTSSAIVLQMRNNTLRPCPG